MLATAALSLLLTPLPAQLPDELDIFRTNPKANVLLLLDSSCSMGPSYGTLPTGCSWYAATYNGSNTNLSKQQMMKAALMGCSTSADGILDRWNTRLNLSIWHFGSSVTNVASFGATLASLETAVAGIPASGGTPMTSGLMNSGFYFRNAFNDSTHPSCRQDYIVLMSDGEPNGGDATFNYECTSPVESLYVTSTQPWNGSRYLYQESTSPETPRDLLCATTGTQPIRTHTVGFEALSGFNESTLINIADSGDGSFIHATNISELSASFEAILNTIVNRSRVDFSAPSTQNVGLFSSNYAYSSYFRPVAGPWVGTVKKHCIEPRRLANGRYDTSQTNCMYTSSDGQTLTTNPTPQDLFTYVTSANADAGGTGEAMFSLLGAGAGAVPSSPYYTRRNIFTWKDGTGYVAVNPTTMTNADTWANGCDHYRLLNYLHGYSYSAASCTTGYPAAVRSWPMGAPIHSSPVLLKYGRCHDSNDSPVSGVCFVAQAMNDGMLHFFDAADGRETSALIPAELWKLNRVAKHRIDRINDQPNTDYVQRYLVDGDMRLAHDDLDGDTVIDPGETARLIFGLGRGGSVYYQLAVSTLPSGVLSTAANPIYPLPATSGTAFEELRETWHAPYVGRATFGGTKYMVAAFGSGHVAALDEPTATMGTQPAGLQPAMDLSTVSSVACSGAGNFAENNGFSSGGTTLCTVAYRPGCAGTRASQCYDTGYWATNPASTLPLTLSFGPLRYSSGGQRGAAYRVQFANFDLGPGDTLVIKDGRGLEIYGYSGTSLDGGGWTSWIYDPDNLGFYLELRTNGIDSVDRGINVSNIQYIPVPSADTSVSAHNPTLFVVDATKWNGSSPRSFTTPPTSGAALLRVARQCTGSDTGTCIDQSTVAALADLKCPITAEVSAYTEGDVVRAFYFATECGEIWKAYTNDGGAAWSARRLLSLNTPGATGRSRDFRKIFRRLDVVPSSCPGRRVVGLYFGTGNVQRPQATDELGDSGLNDGRDVIGVVWDDGSIRDLEVTDLQDVTDATPGTVNAVSVYASGDRGWYIRLGANERMLRNPFVLDGVAYFKTRQTSGGVTECDAGAGTDRVYGVDNCTASPTQDSDGSGTTTNADRVRWSGTTDIGSEMFTFTPRNGPPIVSPGDTQSTTPARLNSTRGRNIARFYMWRRPERDR